MTSPGQTFAVPGDLLFNEEKIGDPKTFAKTRGAASWLYLNGEEFAAMEGGMSYAQVEEAVPKAAQVISDPPRSLDLDLAGQQIAALDSLPRPTLVTCRAGPRASAVVYMYAGVKSGAEPDAVLAEAERRQAPFTRFDEYKHWVRRAIEAYRRPA